MSNLNFLEAIKKCKKCGYIEENEGKLTITNYGLRNIRYYIQQRNRHEIAGEILRIYKDPVFLLLKMKVDPRQINRHMRILYLNKNKKLDLINLVR